MIKRDIIVVESNELGQSFVKITQNGEFAIKFMSSLLHPFIESYWVTLLFLNNINSQLSLTQTLMAKQV